jgi:hypothetical protein
MGKDSTILKRRQVLAAKMNEPKDFMARNLQIFLVVGWIIYPIAMVYSAITEGGHLFSRFSETMGSPIIAAIVTLLLVVMIEVGVIMFGRSTVDDLVEGVAAEDASFQRMFVAKLILFLACFVTSTTLSITGAGETTAFIRKSQDPPVQLAPDSIQQRYDHLLALQAATIQDARTMTWKGKITREGSKIIQTAQAEIRKIEDQRNKELAALEQTNTTTLSEWMERTHQHSNWATWLSGLGQLIMLLTLIITGVYRAGEMQCIEAPQSQSTSSPTPSGQGASASQPAAAGAGSSASIDPAALAALVAAELERQQGAGRKVVKPFQAASPPPSSSGNGPKAQAVGPQPTPQPVGADTSVAQESQPPTGAAPTDSHSAAPTVVERTVAVRIDKLKRDISTYYPRCFSKAVTEKGSANPATCQRNRAKVEALVQELGQCGVEAEIDFVTFKQILWK